MKKNWADFFDEKGILIHRPGPDFDGTPSGGGDSINRIGHFWFCFKAQEEVFGNVRLFPADALSYSRGLNASILLSWDHEAGCVARHWKGYPDASRGQYGTSRDQFMPITVAALMGDTFRGYKLLDYACRRHGMMPNFRPLAGDFHGDFLLPEHWSTLLRANIHTGRLGKVAMFLGDLWRWLPILIRILITHWDHDNTGDSLNLNQEILLGVIRRPNPVTRLQAWFFGRFVYGGPQYQLDRYFRQPHAPMINELYQPLVERFYPSPMFHGEHFES